MKKGYIQVYTGNGKGKTTAALGLSLRAAGAGLRVYIAQFLKTGDYSEIKALKRHSEYITIEQFGLNHFIKGKPSSDDIKAAQQGLRNIKSAITSDTYDVIIMEEANVAVTLGLLSSQDILDIISIKPDDKELVITGRGADSQIIEKADLVTEMKEIKHYFHKGVEARKKKKK
ncbi:MAG: cob(I)yrinic acid a,c-diamide adenosyltransferase [Deltaproteobacteria bacterium]|nr:cob(I)yrinic acid a,c-diamide adenosyltransferase [Deltaproteobacteria bacterium]